HIMEHNPNGPHQNRQIPVRTLAPKEGIEILAAKRQSPYKACRPGVPSCLPHPGSRRGLSSTLHNSRRRCHLVPPDLLLEDKSGPTEADPEHVKEVVCSTYCPQ